MNGHVQALHWGCVWFSDLFRGKESIAAEFGIKFIEVKKSSRARIGVVLL